MMVTSVTSTARLCLVLQLLVASLPSVRPLPGGAASCSAGINAIQSPHSFTGSLAQGGITVQLDSQTLSDGASADFAILQDHVLTVNFPSGYKGILFRLGSNGGVSTTSALAVQSGDSSLRLASDTCISIEGVGGVTHRNKNQKTKSSVTLRLDSAVKGLPLDISVVVDLSSSNRAFSSSFTLNAVANTPPPPPPPTSPPPPPPPAPVAPVGTSPPPPPPAPVSTNPPVAPIVTVILSTTRAPVAPVFKPTRIPVDRPNRRSRPPNRRHHGGEGEIEHGNPVSSPVSRPTSGSFPTSGGDRPSHEGNDGPTHEGGDDRRA